MNTTARTLADPDTPFADGGYTAVGIDPHKLPRVVALPRRGVTLRVLLDSTEQASCVAEGAREAGVAVPTQIEIGPTPPRSSRSAAFCTTRAVSTAS
ncbi:hypothetical protein [Actinoallomurus acaciae]|uniref:Uncharacterized protein n=1 Tax=Actinoallomurus acaciae TaxID=502577 RepID=A0ABV5YCC7_9ACTN